MRLRSEMESLKFSCKRLGRDYGFNRASFALAVKKESFKTGGISLINGYQCDTVIR
jgi:hypothetical protein